MTQNDIVQKLWNLCDVLKDDGINYSDYVSELVMLLFVKMVDELDDEFSTLAKIYPEQYKWSHFEVTETMLNQFIGKVHEKRLFPPAPRVVVCVPCKSTLVERRAIREAVFNAGARDVRLIEEPMAAAIGAGMPVEQACGSMVVDVGGGTTEIAIISLQGCVYADSLRIGGDVFDEQIINYVRKAHGCVIGETTAEIIKKEVGMALPEPDSKTLEIEVRGRNLAEGVPRAITVTSDEITQAISDPLQSIVSAVKSALEQIIV
jgi:rod shape-determining protein MreB and related proteins